MKVFSAVLVTIGCVHTVYGNDATFFSNALDCPINQAPRNCTPVLASCTGACVDSVASLVGDVDDQHFEDYYNHLNASQANYSQAVYDAVTCLNCACDIDKLLQYVTNGRERIDKALGGTCNPLDSNYNGPLSNCAKFSSCPAGSCSSTECTAAFANDTTFVNTFSDLEKTRALAQDPFATCLVCTGCAEEQEKFPNQTLVDSVFGQTCKLQELLAALPCSQQQCSSELAACSGDQDCASNILQLADSTTPGEQAQIAQQMLQKPVSRSLLECIPCKCSSDLANVNVTDAFTQLAKVSLCTDKAFPSCTTSKCASQLQTCVQDSSCLNQWRGALLAGGQASETAVSGLATTTLAKCMACDSGCTSDLTALLGASNKDKLSQASCTPPPGKSPGTGDTAPPATAPPTTAPPTTASPSQAARTGPFAFFAAATLLFALN
mmetsp:Transcript_4954/g.7512  ORF Transcript_4954/g.7512 Transcript_4954/m.7512 type:complete len:437 (+) Transcript_4954:100-1410(+)